MKSAAPSGAHLSLDRLVALASVAVPMAYHGLSRGRVAGLSGPRRGEGGDLYDLRPFVDGDDRRQMDPAATARSGRPQLRRRHEEVERSLMLVVDMRTPMLWGTRGRFRSVAAAEAAALEGWRWVRASGRCGLAILRGGGMEWLPARPREASMLEIAGALARTHAEILAEPANAARTQVGSAAVPRPLVETLPGIAARLASGTAILLATGLDTPGEGFGPTVTALARRNPLEILLVRDAVETAPPPGTFTARIGAALSRGRFGPSPSAEMLSEHAIPFRPVRCDQPEEPTA